MENSKDVNILNSEQLKIEKNVIEMDQSIIQLSNVSSVSLRYPPRYTNSNAVIFGAVIGFMLLFAGGKLTLAGLVLLGVCGFMIYRTWEKNQNLGKNIIIATAGGHYWINSKDDAFSMKVIDIIRNLMNDPDRNSNIIINLDKFNILNNGNMVYGNVSNSTINKDSGNYANNTASIIGDDNNIEGDMKSYNTTINGSDNKGINVGEGSNNVVYGNHVDTINKNVVDTDDIPELRI